MSNDNQKTTISMQCFSNNNQNEIVKIMPTGNPLVKIVEIFEEKSGIIEELMVMMHSGGFSVINKNNNVSAYDLEIPASGKFEGCAKFKRNSGPLTNFTWLVDDSVSLDFSDRYQENLFNYVTDHGYLMEVLGVYVTVSPVREDTSGFTPVTEIDVQVHQHNPWQ